MYPVFSTNPGYLKHIFVSEKNIGLTRVLVKVFSVFLSLDANRQPRQLVPKVVVWKQSFAIRPKWPRRQRQPTAVAARRWRWQRLQNKVKNIFCCVFVRKLGGKRNVKPWGEFRCVCGGFIFGSRMDLSKDLDDFGEYH